MSEMPKYAEMTADVQEFIKFTDHYTIVAGYVYDDVLGTFVDEDDIIEQREYQRSMFRED
ncbi:MAG TPA: hypothetical protein PLV00_07075 [Caldisericia bacterium]|nr:hypothetical protein [Caldisericia bacterium]